MSVRRLCFERRSREFRLSNDACRRPAPERTVKRCRNRYCSCRLLLLHDPMAASLADGCLTILGFQRKSVIPKTVYRFLTVAARNVGIDFRALAEPRASASGADLRKTGRTPKTFKHPASCPLPRPVDLGKSGAGFSGKVKVAPAYQVCCSADAFRWFTCPRKTAAARMIDSLSLYTVFQFG